MDLEEFGRRVAIIRETVLNISQDELAKELGTYQAIVSKLENGIGGGSIFIVLDLINLLEKKKLSAHMLFREPFDVNLLSKRPNEDLNESLKELREVAKLLNLHVKKEQAKKHKKS
jgi:predicted transcriptional regulator